MSVYLENLKKNKKIAICSAISLFGLFLNFIGICMGQGQLKVPEDVVNPIGLYWFYTIFYVLTIFSIIGSYATETTAQYRLLLVSLLSISVAYVPSNIDTFLLLATTKQMGNGGGVTVAGLVFFILPLFPLLVWIGSEQDAALQNVTMDQIKKSSFTFTSTNTLGDQSMTRTSRQQAYV